MLPFCFSFHLRGRERERGHASPWAHALSFSSSLTKHPQLGQGQAESKCWLQKSNWALKHCQPGTSLVTVRSWGSMWHFSSDGWSACPRPHRYWTGSELTPKVNLPSSHNTWPRNYLVINQSTRISLLSSYLCYLPPWSSPKPTHC